MSTLGPSTSQPLPTDAWAAVSRDTATSSEARPGWLQRWLLRFFWLYCLGFMFPFPLEVLTELVNAKWVAQAFNWQAALKDQVIRYVGEQWLHVEIVIQPTGSGDTMRNYVSCLILAVASWGLSLVWMVLDYRGRMDRFLHHSLRVLLRFFLAVVLFQYGIFKVFPLQFPLPSLSRLEQPLGQFSPMGLLWTFMGFSPVFCCFTGLAECVGGLLLTTRRTTLLGALILIAVMSVIVMMNLCFDVPVKLYSMHYLGMAFLLVIPDLRRLLRFFILGQPAPAPSEFYIRKPRWVNPVLVTLRTLVVLGFFGMVSFSAWSMYQEVQSYPLFYGSWKVTQFRWDHQEVTGDAMPEKPGIKKWTQVMVNRGGLTIIRLAGPAQEAPQLRFRITADEQTTSLTLTHLMDPEKKITFQYQRPHPKEWHLQGTWEGKPLEVRLQLNDAMNTLLLTRDFHWIQELPFNR